MARGIWKGTLGFGLVSIGVELFGVEDHEQSLDLDLLDRRDHAPIGYRKYNKVTGKEVKSEDIVKGYEIKKGRYIILESDDLKAANPKVSQTIDIIGFVRASDIDLVYFDKPYMVGPLKGSTKAYALLVKTLEDTEQVGIAQVVIRTKQYLAAIYPYQHAVIVHLLRYEDEVRQPEDIHITADTDGMTFRPQELKMAVQLVNSMAMEWDPTQFRDTYREDVIHIIEQLAESGEDVMVEQVADGSPEPRVLDLVAALKSSLAERAKAASAKRTSPKRSSSGAKKSSKKSA